MGDDPPGESIVSLPGQEIILEWSDTIGKVTSLAQLGRNEHSIFNMPNPSSPHTPGGSSGRWEITRLRGQPNAS